MHRVAEPEQHWLSKVKNNVDNGLKIYGTMRGLYEAGSAIAAGARAVAPLLSVAAL